jgi:hypothetical protein
MKVGEIREIAKQKGIKAGKMKKVELVRAIQAGEGNSPCFQTGRNPCDQLGCCWRSDCIAD